MTSYANILVSQALAIDPSATAQTFRVTESEDEDSPFIYCDNASSRAGISAISAKLRLRRIGIFGLGGSGAYILDLVAKTPVAEIAIFDGDSFLQHNAFRAPGAATVEALRERLLKVDYYRRAYSAMHKGIVAHPHFIDATNVERIGEFDFAFLSMDPGDAKRALVERLERANTPFVDVLKSSIMGCSD
jgi:tRNA A37 threonylcarbamoyladenosine dehydratase